MHLKANDSVGVLKTLLAKGAGVDVVSGGELALALSAGASADKIVFSGVGKTNQELADALDAAVMQINVESEAELERLNQVAVSKGVQAPIALRVNPDVDAGTLDAISTGRATDKFGVNYGDAERLYQEAAQCAGPEAHGHRHAYRLPDRGRCPFRRRLRQAPRALGPLGCRWRHAPPV